MGHSFHIFFRKGVDLKKRGEGRGVGSVKIFHPAMQI
jgi:hypothetical protein